MSDILRHIRSIDEDAAPTSTGARLITSVEPLPADRDAPILPPHPQQASQAGETGSALSLGPVPWLWIACVLIGWALIVALSAWWIGDGSVAPREIWVWVMVWAVPGLTISALLTRSAAQAAERDSTLLRLTRARGEITQLEDRLKDSTASMFNATQTLSDATQILLEQVDTSRDDLRNQIGSAQALADVLKAQTAGLLQAQTTYTDTVKSSLDAPDRRAPLSTATAPKDTDTPQLNLRAAPDTEEVFESAKPDEPTLPKLGLRPLDTDDTDTDTTTTGPVSAVQPPAETEAAPRISPIATANRDWRWSDMLRNVDEAVPASETAHEVLMMLKREGVSPDVIVDEGTVLDALSVWETQGRRAMGQLLSIRYDEPARIFKTRLDADAEAFDKTVTFSNARASALEVANAQTRQDDARTEIGRAWLFVQAVLAL